MFCTISSREWLLARWGAALPVRAGRVRIDCVCLRFQFGRRDVSDGDSLHLGCVLICESVAGDGGTQSALRASKARVTGGVLRVGRQLPSASRWVPCGAEQELIGHSPLTVAEQRIQNRRKESGGAFGRNVG